MTNRDRTTRLRRNAPSERAQSETIGVLLLTAVVIIVIGIGSVVVLGGQADGQTPVADFEPTVTSGTVSLQQTGGDAFEKSDLVVVVQGAGQERHGMETFTELSGNGDGKLDPGEQVRRSYTISQDAVRIVVVHEPTGTAVFNRKVAVEQPAVLAAFDWSLRSPSAGEAVNFDGSVSSGPVTAYRWDFDGDGTTDATGATASNTYGSAGSYEVSLTVETDGGTTEQTTRTVTVGATSPTASFTYSPSSPATGESVSFDGSGSSDPDGSIASYEWDFDGDGTTDATGATASNAFGSTGSYDVTLTVTDDSGNAATKTRTVSVSGGSPTASFTYSPSNPSTDETVSFDGSGSSDSDGTITSYEWDFNGDGTTNATGETATTSYSEDGSKTVTLTLTDDSGKTDSVRKTVSVANDAPTADFSYSPSNPDTQDTISFTASASDSDGSISSYTWDFDDGGTTDDATGSSTSNSYGDDGSYDVTMTVTDDDGATTTVTKTVQVDNAGPTADFTYSPSKPRAGDTTSFDGSGSSDVDGSIVSYEWDFGDGTTRSGETPTHTYDSKGEYTVTLTVTDDDGATATTSETVKVKPAKGGGSNNGKGNNGNGNGNN
jgi:PKD repeat protein